MHNTEPFATRLPRDEAKQLKRALEQTGRNQSAHLARAIRYYHQENPDEIPALHRDDPEGNPPQREDSDRGPLEELEIIPPELGSEWTNAEDG